MSTVIVDNTDPDFSKVGKWKTAKDCSGFYGTNYRIAEKGDGSSSGTWTFTINESGEYSVYAQWAGHNKCAPDAPYTLYNNDLPLDTVSMDQSKDSGEFNLIGTFWLNDGILEVVLTNGASGKVVADAVMVQFAGHETGGSLLYVSIENGDDANPGTLTEPWKTIGKANKELQIGDTVYIRKGTYNEIIEPFNSGSEGQKITYKAFEGESVTIRGEAGKYPAISIGWKVNGPSYGNKNYIVIDGFNVSPIDPEITSPRIWVYGEDSHHNEIKNCTTEVEGEIGYGISVAKAEHTTIENNYIKGGKIGIGLSSKGARYTTIRNNTVLDTHHNCINVGSGKGIPLGLLIEGNTLCGSHISDGIQFEANYDLEYDEDSSREIIIRDNILCHNAENGVDLKGAAEAVIERNIFYGNTGDGDGEGTRSGGLGGIMHGSNTGSRDVIIRNNIFYDNKGAILVEIGYKVYNNVVVANNRDYTGPNSDYDDGGCWVSGFSGLGFAHHVLSRVGIKNNIIGNHNYGEICMRRSEEPNSMDINNNLYLPGADFVDLDNTKLGYFENWKAYIENISTIVGDDEDSIEADPLFVNVPDYPVGSPDLFDFHLQSVSPCIDAGAFLTKTINSGSGSQISVENAGYFCNGYDIADGDLIQLEGQAQTARVTNVNYDNNVITIDTELVWQSGQGVSLPYYGSKPDIGAIEDLAAPNPPAEHAPVAYDQNVTTNKDTPKAITLSATDEEGDLLSYDVVSQPLHGTLNGTAPDVTYTPDTGYVGTDSFTFDAFDGELYSEDATVSITVKETVTGLVAHWKFDETSGATASDSSGNGYDGTLQDGPVWRPADGKIGGALEFDGSDDCVDIEPIDFDYSITYSAWIKPTEITGRHIALGRYYDGYRLGIWNGKYYSLSIQIEDTGYPVYITDPVAGVWAHLALTYDGITVRYYLNGTEVYTAQASGGLSKTHYPWQIGANGKNNNYFKGLIDDVRIYDRALSAAEIEELANSGQ
jgi:parallel beta-helix repeat protein